MKLKITHTTQYAYDAPVIYGLQQVRLTPKTDKNQTVLNWQIAIDGGELELAYADEYQNQTLLETNQPRFEPTHFPSEASPNPIEANSNPY